VYFAARQRRSKRAGIMGDEVCVKLSRQQDRYRRRTNESRAASLTCVLEMQVVSGIGAEAKPDIRHVSKLRSGCDRGRDGQSDYV